MSDRETQTKAGPDRYRPKVLRITERGRYIVGVAPRVSLLTSMLIRLMKQAPLVPVARFDTLEDALEFPGMPDRRTFIVLEDGDASGAMRPSTFLYEFEGDDAGEWVRVPEEGVTW